jgi:phosphoenolpyruvate carboxykinase (GTP)
MLEKFKKRFSTGSYEKLSGIKNVRFESLTTKFVELCNPKEIFVCDDSEKDLNFIREQAIYAGEELKLSKKGHTLHFDGYNDQARDKENTRLLIPSGVEFEPSLNALDRDKGIEDVENIMRNIMEGKRLYIQFFCLGPQNSVFSVPAVQLTDSPYVAHAETLLYRTGMEEFKRIANSSRFFFLIHSQGRLENGVSADIDKRRVYVNIKDNMVYSANTQYGGNTIGLKKLSMRLAIHLASHEGWLTEHMFVMGAHGPKGRVTYFTGAFPSMCGKTSTSMMPGETIIGDDIAYLRKIDGEIRAVNVERGMFGIIQGINSKDDPLIWDVINKEGEIVFLNVLKTEKGEPYWVGKDGKVPQKGINHSGEWFLGKLDDKGNEIPASHLNARFTFDMKLLNNLDPKIDDPSGVPVGGIIYGGRDSHTSVPVREAFDWNHGVLTMGASLESETTAATLGKSGVRSFDPMSNMDFVSIPLGKYIKNYLNFGLGLTKTPKIFAVNYFLRDYDGNPVTDKVAKRVWLKWMELRVHEEVGAIRTPIGFIPKYEDLKPLFKKVLDQDFTEKQYTELFTLRIPENLSRIERIKDIFMNKVHNAPAQVINAIWEQERRLEKAREKYGYYIPPQKFIEG